MKDLNEFFSGIPAGVLSGDTKAAVRIVYDSLSSCFSTGRTYVEDIILSDDGKGVSIVLRTPYLAAEGKDSAHLADLFRIADAVAFYSIPAEDGFDAAIVFTIVE